MLAEMHAEVLADQAEARKQELRADVLANDGSVGSYYPASRRGHSFDRDMAALCTKDAESETLPTRVNASAASRCAGSC